MAFSRCSTCIYQAFDGQTEFLQVFNFTISCYLQKSWQFDAREKMCFTVIFACCVLYICMQKRRRLSAISVGNSSRTRTTCETISPACIRENPNSFRTTAVNVARALTASRATAALDPAKCTVPGGGVPHEMLFFRRPLVRPWVWRWRQKAFRQHLRLQQ